MSVLRPAAGFTLFELIVTLAIVAIMAAVAVPSFQTFFVSSRAQTQTANFVEALNYARSEAVRRAKEVRVVAASGNTSWQQGWSVEQVTPAVTLRVQPAFSGNGTMTSGESQVVFNNLGQLSSISVGSSITFRYCFASGYDDQERFVIVNHIGHIQSGRAVCP